MTEPSKPIIYYKPGSIIVAKFQGQQVAILNPIESRPGTKEIITADIVQYDPISGMLETGKYLYAPEKKEMK
jgi:hypothetical protein